MGRNFTRFIYRNGGTEVFKAICLILTIFLIPARASASPPDRKFDEFSFSDCGSLTARLDNFAVQVMYHKTAEGLVYVYGGKVTRKGEIEMYVNLIRNYLVERREVDSKRLRIVQGGYRELAGAEIWIVPQGATAP